MRVAALVIAAITVASTASAQVLTGSDLQITEMWVGGLDGSEATSDWFEVTNLGDSAATGLDGTLYYDDDSDDPTKEDQLVDIDTIAPGESVIYLVSWEDDFSKQDAIDAFTAMWGSPAGDLTGVQIGVVDGGSGLGGGGDAANLFDGNTAGANTIDRAQYASLCTNWASFSPAGDGTLFPFPSIATTPNFPGAYVGNFSADDAGTANAIGSPGFFGPIPEPASVATILVALLGLGGVRARRS